MPGTFSPPSWISDPGMHHGTCVTHVSWCMPGYLTSGFLWSRWRGKRSRHSQRIRNPQFYASGKRPIAKAALLYNEFGNLTFQLAATFPRSKSVNQPWLCSFPETSIGVQYHFPHWRELLYKHPGFDTSLYLTQCVGIITTYSGLGWYIDNSWSDIQSDTNDTWPLLYVMCCIRIYQTVG